jgi:hypothetical protein
MQRTPRNQRTRHPRLPTLRRTQTPPLQSIPPNIPSRNPGHQSRHLRPYLLSQALRRLHPPWNPHHRPWPPIPRKRTLTPRERRLLRLRRLTLPPPLSMHSHSFFSFLHIDSHHHTHPTYTNHLHLYHKAIHYTYIPLPEPASHPLVR